LVIFFYCEARTPSIPKYLTFEFLTQLWPLFFIHFLKLFIILRGCTTLPARCWEGVTVLSAGKHYSSGTVYEIVTKSPSISTVALNLSHSSKNAWYCSFKSFWLHHRVDLVPSARCATASQALPWPHRLVFPQRHVGWVCVTDSVGLDDPSPHLIYVLFHF
jgi:hypothetical protein